MTEETTIRITRRLAAILAADVAGYSRMMEADEAGHGRRVAADLERDLQSGRCRAAWPYRQDDGRWRACGVRQRRRCGRMRGGCSARDGRAQLGGRSGRSSSGSASISAKSSSRGTIFLATASTSPRGWKVRPRRAAFSLSDVVHAQVSGKVGVTFADAGEIKLKNIDRPMRAWRWDAGEAPAEATPKLRLDSSR